MLLETIEMTFLISHSQWNFLSFMNDKEWKGRVVSTWSGVCSSCLR